MGSFQAANARNDSGRQAGPTIENFRVHIYLRYWNNESDWILV